jgi:hypothetical protein
MRIPKDAEIPAEKLTRYLLVYRVRNDKSGFLAQAGFTLENPAVLEQAIRQLVEENDAIQDRQNAYGTFFQVAGVLNGPDRVLHVVTVWLNVAHSERFRFVTLKPMR